VSHRVDTSTREPSFGLRRFALAGVLAGSLIAGLATPGWSATPASGTVGPSRTSFGWTGQTFAVGATADPSLCGSSGSLCDHMSVSVASTSAYWNAHTGNARIAISWGSSADNFDLYVDRAGKLVGSSTSSSSTSESVTVPNPSGTYSVVVVPKLVADSGYHGSVSFSSRAKPAAPSPKPSPKPSPNPTPAPSPSGGGDPTGGGGIPTALPTALPTLVPTAVPTLPTGVPTIGGIPGGGGPDQPGAPHVFPSAKGPIFRYHGPFHFKPPFTIGDSPGKTVVPPGGSNLGGGGPVQPPGGTGGGNTAQVRSAAADPTHHGLPALLWVLLPVCVLLIIAIASVLFEREAKPAGTEERSNRPTR
jgi:hypothetical protein